MLNKNDPLIGAVQEVMKKNQAERNAARLVNEKFGVHDRRALPHEKQGAWDAAYQQVLSEGLHPNQQKLDVHEPEKDELTSDDFRKLRAKKKPMEEATDGDTTSPSSMGIKKPDYATGTPDYAKSKEQTVNRAAKTSLPAGTMKEAKSNAYAIGMSAVQKSTGDKPPMEKKNITKAHDIAKKIIAKKKMNEGFNNRHDLSVTASAEKQVVADQLNEKVGNPLLLNKAKTGTKPKARIGDTGIRRTISGTNDVQTRLANLRKKPTALDTKRDAALDARTDKTTDFGNTVDSIAVPFAGAKQKFDAGDKKGAAVDAAIDAATLGFGGPVARFGKKVIDKGVDVYRSSSKISKAATSTTTSAVPKITKGTGQGNRIAAPRRSGEGPWGSTKPPEVKASTRTVPSGTFAANLQRARQTAQSGRVGGSTVGATQQAARLASRSKLAQTTQSGRVGGSTVGATQQAARLAARQRLSATARDVRAGAGKVVSAVRNNPKLAAGAAAGAAMTGFAASKVGNQPPSVQAKPQKDQSRIPPTTTAPTAPKVSPVAMTARKIEATPRKVSDTEIMNAPQYKQAVKAVGGEAGARKIQAGTDVAGVGKVDKGQTIWSKVKSQLEKQPVKGFEAGANKGGAGR